MYRHLLPLLIACLFLSSARADEAVKQEWARFAGTWLRIAYESDGRKVAAGTAQRFRLTLRANATYTLHVDNQVVVEGTARLDPAAKPKAIDMTPTTGTSKGQTLRGIYELDGDEYRLCYAPAGQERPKTFAAAAGSGHVLTVYRREKK